MAQQRFERAEAAEWFRFLGSALLVLFKGIVGVLAGSKALIADAAHSAVDAAGSLTVLLGMHATMTAPNHHRIDGRNRAEAVASLIISVLLTLFGFEIGRAALMAIYNGVPMPPKSFALLAIIVSFILREAMFRYEFRRAAKTADRSQLSGAWERRSDIYGSLAALAGVGGAMLGSYFHLPQLYVLDPAAGLLVSLLVIQKGLKSAVSVLHDTAEHSLGQEDAEDLVEAVQRIKGVIAVEYLRAREHGHYVVVDVNICVNPRISVMEGNDIAKAVKTHLMKRFIHIADVFIHVNPYDPGYPYKNLDIDPDDQPTLLH